MSKAPYLWILVAATAISCGGPQNPPFTGPWPKAKNPPPLLVAEREGFTFRLQNGSPPAPPKVAVAAATPLDDKATAAVLARLPAMSKGADDEKGFALRESSKPPPRAGKTITAPFPPPQSAKAPDPEEAGPLRVLR